MENIRKETRQLRRKYYHRLQLDDIPADYAIQDYQAGGSEVQAEVKQLLAYADAHDLQPSEEAEILLTAFLGLQIGYRNPTLFHHVVERTYELLPQLLDDDSTLTDAPFGKLTCHLLIQLFGETEDDTLLPDIDRLLSTWQEHLTTEEDRYHLEYWQTLSCCILES